MTLRIRRTDAAPPEGAQAGSGRLGPPQGLPQGGWARGLLEAVARGEMQPLFRLSVEGDLIACVLPAQMETTGFDLIFRSKNGRDVASAWYNSLESAVECARALHGGGAVDPTFLTLAEFRRANDARTVHLKTPECLIYVIPQGWHAERDPGSEEPEVLGFASDALEQGIPAQGQVDRSATIWISESGIKACVEITEAEARDLQPHLFAYFDAANQADPAPEVPALEDRNGPKIDGGVGKNTGLP